jgi:hypothetical protein
MVSQFAYTGKTKSCDESAAEDSMSSLNLDESKMEQAMEALASDAESIDENDPRQAANLMRKLTSMTGLKLGDKMEEALSKMEAGADPDEIEQQMGDIDENDLFKTVDLKCKGHQKRPSRDETIYDM